MKLSAVANKFNLMPCLDAYSGLLAFHGQLSLFDDGKRDSVASERRIISVAPGTSIPARRVVEAAGTRYILGTKSPDSYRGKVIREGYVAHEAPFQANLKTLGQVCRAEPGVTTYTNAVWIKNFAFTEQSSELTPEYQLYFSSTESVKPATFAEFDGRLYLIRAANLGPSGTRVATAEILDEDAVEMAQLWVGDYNPLTDTTDLSATTARVVRMRWQALFDYRHSAAPKFGPDDIQVAVAKTSVAAKVGMKLTLSDGVWFANAVADEGDVWLCKVTRHA